jgi:hypothetical protein
VLRPPLKPMVEPLERRRLLAASFFVSADGDDANPGTDPAQAWRHIQKAFDAATPGSTVTVLPGKYKEKLVVNVSGNATDGFITFQAQGKVVISGKKTPPGGDMISINNRSYVKIVGFEIRDNRGVDNGSAIRLTEANRFIEIRNNRITKITGRSAMGITVYGTDPAAGISNLVIDGNEVFKCQPFPSEAVVLNGNVHDFVVSNNYVHHVNNIAMDFIGGEGRSTDPATDFARNGVVSGNRVTRAAVRGGRDGAGIFVDGAEDIVVERNTVWRNDVGIEVNAIQPSRVARGVVVRDNLVAGNSYVGVSIGGSDLATGSVRGCAVTSNTLYGNDRRRGGDGEIRVQNASGNVVRNNLVSSRPGTALVNVQRVAGANDIDYNLYFAPGRPDAARFAWRGGAVGGLDAFRAAGGTDAHSVFADPLLSNPRRLDFHLRPGSPAMNAGDPLYAPGPAETDADGEARVLGGRLDLGADEAA